MPPQLLSCFLSRFPDTHGRDTLTSNLDGQKWPRPRRDGQDIHGARCHGGPRDEKAFPREDDLEYVDPPVTHSCKRKRKVTLKAKLHSGNESDGGLEYVDPQPLHRWLQ